MRGLGARGEVQLIISQSAVAWANCTAAEMCAICAEGLAGALGCPYR